MFLGKHKRRKMTREEADAIIERAKTEAPLELEKGDLLAMFLAALVVFVPVLLALAGAFAFLWWFIFFIWGN